jgi:hypothetical protein
MLAKTDSVAKKAANRAVETTKLALKDGEVDTDNYEFDEDILKSFESTSKREAAFPTTPGVTLSQYLKLTRENIADERAISTYKGLFITNDANSDWRIDPIRGFGYAQSISMNDLLENHVIKAGLFHLFQFQEQ